MIYRVSEIDSECGLAKPVSPGTASYFVYASITHLSKYWSLYEKWVRLGQGDGCLNLFGLAFQIVA